jgi:hypothetical protein
MAATLSAGFLTALLIGPPDPTPAFRRPDLEFTNAVEHFVRSADRRAVPPEPFVSLLRLLGAPCHRCRELASRDLREHSRDDPRWLFWGRHDRDPEIRLRCNRILRDLTRCPECWGGGWCRVFRTEQPDGDGPCANCGQWAWSHFDSPRECWACGGYGFAWIKGAFE